MTVWFEFNRRWHRLESEEDGWKVGLCKIRVTGSPRTLEIGPDGLYPDLPCPSCRRIIAWNDVEEESAETALGRGFLPAELADPA